MDLSLLTQFVNASKLAGWARALVGALLAALIAKWPLLKEYLDPTTQAALATAASGIVVGVWSHLAKSITGSSASNAVGTASNASDVGAASPRQQGGK